LNPKYLFSTAALPILFLAAVTPAAFAGGLKAGPHGIYALLPSYNSARPVELGRPVWTNPLVNGVTVRTVWKNVQPGADKFDWSFFDEAVADAARNGKHVGISLAAGIFTPDWAYASGVQRFDFTLTGPWIPTRAMTMPEPWDPAFLKTWGATLRAMGQRYDGNPAVAYITMGGLGFSIESFYVKTPEDIAKLQAMGGEKRWLEGAKRVVDLYAEAFPATPFIYAMAPPIKGDMSGTRALVEYGLAKYPGRFGMMHHGLNAQSMPGFYPDQAILKAPSATPAGFQMVWSTVGPEGAQRVKGTLGQALERGVEFHAHFIEVYEDDCQNPACAGDLRTAGRRLGGGGGGE
jgi:hypothetical protein